MNKDNCSNTPRTTAMEMAFKHALNNAQLRKMVDAADKMKRCKHESDNQLYTVNKLSSVTSGDKRCVKCGEFYK